MEATVDEGTAQREEQAELHPLDEERTQLIQREAAPEAVIDRRGRGLGGNRHLGSVVLSFVGVLGAYGAVDFAYYRSLGPGLTVYQGGELSDQAMVAAAVAAACLFVAAAAGRVSALGPLLAGVGLGAGPGAGVVLGPPADGDRAHDNPQPLGHTPFAPGGGSAGLYPGAGG